MINKFILTLIPILIIGCASSPTSQKIYKHEDLGIQIVIPDNWKQISPDEAGQEDADPESDILRLGYFDPKTGEKEGIFVLSVLEIEAQQDKDDLREAIQGWSEIEWKNRSCYFTEMPTDTGTRAEAFIVVEHDRVISFVFGHTKLHADSITNIMENIHFSNQSSEPTLKTPGDSVDGC